jgi:hypothetical protein
MSNKIHTQFDPQTNARLDILYAEWDTADRLADRHDYENDFYNLEAADADMAYETALHAAKSALQAATVAIVDKHTQRTTAALDTADEYAMMKDLEFTLFCGSGRAW